ncbi:2Fe-2S iron-sulfur cluster binding domain-containing protein [Flavihumibacter sp. R14]|nr:2Fe-2S iron-sulfur cluster binding domain-containing protein [Flavihumibacter soli]
MRNYTLKVVGIRKETNDTLTLCFNQPSLRKIKYRAGQYLSLIFRINGRRYVRPYSFSSTPGVDSHLLVTIKRIPSGIVSNHIHDLVRIGDSIEVIEPLGDFVYEAKENITSIYFWGVGSGITPLLSLIKEVLISNSLLAVNLIYGNRNHESTIFLSQIEDLLIKYPKQFKVWHFFTQLTVREDNPDIIEGRINEEYALSILNGVDTGNSQHYICGPAGLKESVKAALNELKVLQDNIFFEDFELIKDPKDFNEINTHTIKLQYLNIEHTLEIIKGKSILEAGLDAGLELPYSCQTGNCSTCKAICLSGEVKMIGLAKNRADLQQDEYLLCCSHPLSDNVYLKI